MIFAVIVERNEAQGRRVMRAFDTLWAWYDAATYTFSESRLAFTGTKPIQLTRIQYQPFTAFHYNNDQLSQTSFPRLFHNIHWDTETVQDLIGRTWKAKVHAEAALVALSFAQRPKVYC